ncbi:hypothetical protein [Ramlibacter alkalitolerans]|uniref:Uncharacterized protein n=1 Tax=Ramlibacter alkalitolerans TaxID=2039631 RepID=A0ABS1JMX3_9BURK|nr:hypothetical protein [Ramlibacter alkalitolerans]MBL0425486.1 hypothetical protein [Ramlibacter alkalitolerans]
MRKAITKRLGGLLACGALALGPVPARAQDPHEQAVDAAFADGVTTAIGVAASGGVIHPVGPLLATAMKAVTFHRASTLPETERPAAYAAASAMWRGGTASNVCITAVFLSGGGFAPACLALGAAWGVKSWNDSEHERRFWERCAILRQFAQRQTVRCIYGPPVPEGAQHEALAAPATHRKVKATLPAPRQELLLQASAPAPAPLAVSYEVEAP